MLNILAAAFGLGLVSSVVWALLFAWLVDRALGTVGVYWATVTYRICAIAFLALAFTSLRALWIARDRPVGQHVGPRAAMAWATHQRPELVRTS